MADLDQRVTRLEQLADKLIRLAREHPVGRAILRKLDIDPRGEA